MSDNHFEKMESYLPADLTDPKIFLAAIFVSYFFIVFRYFLMVTPVYWALWIKRFRLFSPINSDLPPKSQAITEIKWSLITSIIFAFAGVLIGYFWQIGWSRFYLKFDEYPLWWIPLSFIIMMIIHEIYFYASHRLMHHPKLYRRIHKIHHLSLKPSPWASYSFHPIESIIEAAILPVLVLLIPIHPVVFLSYLTFMTISAIINHLGFEVLKNPNGNFAKWFITGTHHGLHHKLFTCNYGLYFTFLDRIFKTNTIK